MPTNFKPNYSITPLIAQQLMLIEAAKQKAAFLPLTPALLASLRETSRLLTTHYSTMIEGNRLLPEEVKTAIKDEGHFPGRERDEREVKGYYAALAQLERYVAQNDSITETRIQTLHALAMSNGRDHIKPTPYRDGENVISDLGTGRIVYLPPEAPDVPKLMRNLVSWINEHEDLPCPLLAAIAHYQFATIHPYFDGNGRTARLLTTLILHLGGFDLKGLYSLEEYYAQDLPAYYRAIAVGPSHNYYVGRAESDTTGWIEYFCQGMAKSFETVVSQMAAQAKGDKDQSHELRMLDPKQRKVLELFKEYDTVTSKQIGDLFGFKARTSSALCKKWVEAEFLEVVDPSKKGRKYRLSTQYRSLVD